MGLRIFGFPTQIQVGFFIMSVLGARSRFSEGMTGLGLEWVFVLFVSILIHELGHAFAMRSQGLDARITLYAFGGLTSTPSSGMQRLGRPQRIFISFAGPLAGFALAAVVYAIQLALPQMTPATATGSSEMVIAYALHDFIFVSFYWGLINLVPALPLDGGHIMEEILGPKREQAICMVSIAASGLMVAWALSQGVRNSWIAILFGYCGVQSFLRLRAGSGNRRSSAGESATPKAAKAPEPTADEPVPHAIQQQLHDARRAIAEERYDEAGTLAELVLANSPPRAAKVSALHVLGWAHLLEGRAEQTRRVLAAVEQEGVDPDVALAGSTLMHLGKDTAARALLEQARAQGDDRKEVVGPLIQLLLKLGLTSRAAAIAFDIVDTLSDDDVRQMAQLAFDGECYLWSAKLREAIFERVGEADDAYEAVRSHSLEGDVASAVEMLRLAVGAGFSDGARAWSDKALETLRASEAIAALEEVLPRPVTSD